MTLRTVLLAGTALGAAALLAGPAFAGSAATTQNEIDTMKQQIQELQQKLDDMQIQSGNDIKEIKEKQDAVQVSLADGKPTFRTGDGLFTMSIRGRAHLDFGDASTSSSLNAAGPISVAGGPYKSGANFRRAEIGVEGTFMRDWGYVFAAQFGGSGNEGGGSNTSGKDQFIKNAYITWNGLSKDLTFRIGAGELPYTLEYATSSNDITFIERAAAVNENISLGSDDGRVNAGVNWNNKNIFLGAWYTRNKTGQGPASGAGTGGNDSDNAVGRAAYVFQPNDQVNVHVGASGTYVLHANSDAKLSLSDRPGIRVTDVKYINTGSFSNIKDAYVYGPEFAANYGPVKVQGEYYVTHFNGQTAKSWTGTASPGFSNSLEFKSWYAQASWMITGETYQYDITKAAYKGVKPKAVFTPGGGFGAWELAVRYSDSNLNDGAFFGGHEKLTTLGLNWYANNNIRFMLNGIHGQENVPSSTAHLATTAGTFNAIALRAQYAF